MEHDRRDRTWALWVAFACLGLTMLPYLYDYLMTGASALYGWFSWYAFNVTDNCVYLSWMRQYADGAWFQRNLFTTELQPVGQVNLFYLVLGKVGGLSGLPLVLVYHLARVAVGLGFLHVAWRLSGMLIPDRAARRAGFLLVCFGAGLGWLPGLWEREFAGPVDIWQPEAVSFLCIYLFPLFTVSLALMLAVFVNLLEAERTRSVWRAGVAGACGFILGNIHTYDVVVLALTWGAWLLATWTGARRVDPGSIKRAGVAALPTALSTAHTYWLIRTDPIFAQRAAVPTLTPSLWWVLLGFGLMAPLAVAGAATLLRRRTDFAMGGRFLAIWAVANVAVAYVPVSFQRKMLMGAHVPTAMLAGVALAALVSRAPQRWRALALALCVSVLGLSNVRFMLRDRGRLKQGGETVRAYMMPGERGAIEWIRRHAPAGAVVQPLPWIAVLPDGRTAFVDTTPACFMPGLSGHAVHAGHWGETPDFAATMGLWREFLMPSTGDAFRRDLLRRSGVRYLVYSQKRDEVRDALTASVLAESPVEHVAPYLRRIDDASNADADVFEVRMEP